LGIYQNRAIVGGKTPYLNSYPHDNLRKIESPKVVLFYSKPEVL